MIEQSPYRFRFLDSLKFLVLDEFDQLLNDTIMPDVLKIIEKLSQIRQTLFFSATINYKTHNDEFFKPFYCQEKPKIYDLTLTEKNEKLDENNLINIKALESFEESDFLNENYVGEKCNDENENEEEYSKNEKNIKDNMLPYLQENKKIVKNLTQNFILVPNNTKEHYLINILLNEFKKQYVIIFVSSCKRAHFIYLFLKLFNLRVSVIHSKMPQKKRFENLEIFKNKRNNILVSTDISSRGLDIQNVQLVLNYDVPRSPQDYIHRVGRTARAGNKGLSLSFVTQYDIDLITAIEKEIEIKMEEKPIEESAILEDISLVSKAIRVVQMKIYESGFMEKLDERKARDNKNKINLNKNNK